MILLEITTKQKEILYHLYSFRYLTTNQLQKLFKHKDKTTVKEWLKDLREKGYIQKIESEEETFITRTKPHVYCLGLTARHLLKKDENCDLVILNKIYKVKKAKPKFINKCLSIADMYLFFQAQKEPEQELEFFNENELVRYDYFPEELPSAYLTLTSQDGTQRYFLEVFDIFDPPFVLRKKLNMYLSYAKSGSWEASTNDEALPTILFVCPSKRLQSHLYFRAKAKFDKAFEESIELYLTSWETVQNASENIWEKVSIT